MARAAELFFESRLKLAVRGEALVLEPRLVSEDGEGRSAHPRMVSRSVSVSATDYREGHSSTTRPRSLSRLMVASTVRRTLARSAGVVCGDSATATTRP